MEARADARVVFRGQVVSVRSEVALHRRVLWEAYWRLWDALDQVVPLQAPPSPPFDPPEETLVAVFQVHRSWKGAEAGQRVTVRTPLHSGTCGLAFEEGMTYLVFAWADGDALVTGLCSRTARIHRAVQDIRELNRIADEERSERER